jgi:hypothetical protein
VNAELRNTVASQSEALKIARSTLHNQRADIERLRVALEAGGVRGSGKVDARAVNESQRLAAELSRTQEELERARTSAEEFAFLRREMTRLAQHILAAARTQGTTLPQQRMVIEVAQAFPQFGGLETAEAPQEPEVAYHATNGSGNGAAHHEPAMAEPPMQAATVVEEYTEISARSEDMLAPAEEAHAEDESEAEPQRASIAQRFAARRERRRAGRASGGGTLRERLRGLVAEQPKT